MVLSVIIMDKKALFLTAVVIPVLFVLGIFLFSSKPAGSNNLPEGLVLYYGNTCPHCKELDELIQKNNIKDKVSFNEKEVFVNRENSRELTRVAKSCGLSDDSIGVPFLYAEGKCLVGTDDIFDYLSKKASESANMSFQRKLESI